MKVTDERMKELLDAGKDAKQIALETGMSYSNSVWRVGKIKKANGVIAPAPIIKDNTPKAIKPAKPEAIKPEPVAPVVIAECSDDLVKQFIPAMPKNYICRDIDNDIETWLRLNPETGEPLKSVALIGESGSGKNMAVQQYSAKNGLPMLVIPCDDAQVLRELLGYWQAVNGSTVWHDGLLTRFLRQPCVVLFDEVNCLPAGKLFMLHELLENRKLFIKDAPSDKAVIKLFPQVRVFLAMNPPTAQYSGTNRLNVALGSRPAWIEVKPFEKTELGVSTGDKNMDNRIINFYNEAQRVIKDQKIRVAISKRNIDAIANAIRLGASVRVAVAQGFINSALATASIIERDALMNLATIVFGATTMGVRQADMNGVVNEQQ